MKRKYYIVYKPDESKNHYFESESKDNEEMNNDNEVLDHIMMLDDGDLSNYEVYIQII